MSLSVLGLAFAALLMMKIMLSFFYLHSGVPGMPQTSLAHAQNKTGGISAVKEENPVKETSERDLMKQERDLKAKEQKLNKQEAELARLKKDIDTRLAELNDLQTRLTAYAKRLADREQALEAAKNQHLVSLYSSMDPAKAAAIMDKLKLPTVVSILRNMKGKNAGQIMAMMNPERGALISEKLSQQD